MNSSGLTTHTAPSGRSELLLRAAERNLRASRKADAQRLRIAHEWALTHRTTMYECPDARRDVRALGAARVPVWVYASAELAIALEIHPQAAQRLMADSVDLVNRLPNTWSAVQSLGLEAWVARKIVAATSALDDDDAQWVDLQLSEHLSSLPTGRLLNLVEARVVGADPVAADAKAEKMRRQRMLHLSRETSHGSRSLFARCDAADATRFFETADKIAQLMARHQLDASAQDPETLDQLRARAVGLLADPQAALDFLAGRDPRRGKAVLYVHTTLDQLQGRGGVARIEGLGPATLAMLRTALAHDHVSVKPVIDLNDGVWADSYEVPARIGERLRLTKPADVFPWAESLSRGMDQDHTQPFQHHGPPGQTSIENLGLMIRRHHRIKTHAVGWELKQLPGHRYHWTTPHHRRILVDRDGTRRADPVHEPRIDIVYESAN